MKIELKSIHIDKFAIAPGLNNNDLIDGTIEELELEHSLPKGNGQSAIKIILTWHLELNTMDLNKVMVAAIGHQVLVCKPDNQNNPLQSIRKAIIVSHNDFQQAFKDKLKNTFLSKYIFRAFDFERAAYKAFDLILGK